MKDIYKKPQYIEYNSRIYIYYFRECFCCFTVINPSKSLKMAFFTISFNINHFSVKTTCNIKTAIIEKLCYKQIKKYIANPTFLS